MYRVKFLKEIFFFIFEVLNKYRLVTKLITELIYKLRDEFIKTN